MIAGRAPSAGGGQFWLVLAGDATVDRGDPLPANSCIFVGPDDPAFAGASGPLGAELLCLQFRRRARIYSVRYRRIRTGGSGVTNIIGRLAYSLIQPDGR